MVDSIRLLERLGTYRASRRIKDFAINLFQNLRREKKKEALRERTERKSKRKQNQTSLRSK